MSRGISWYNQAIDFQRTQAATAQGVVAETYLDLLENDHDRKSVLSLGSKAAAAVAIYESAKLSITGIETAKAEAVISRPEVAALPYPYANMRLTEADLQILSGQE